MPDLTILSYDIETTTNDMSKFPDSKIYSNKIT